MMVLGIPVNEMLQSHPRGIFFLMHGHFGNKSFAQFIGLAEQLFALWFDVVSIDAYKHGERLQPPYIKNDAIETTLEMVTVVEQTLKDIVHLYQHHYIKHSQQVSILGVSMGGHISFLLNRFLDLEFCIPIIGSPNLRLHYDEKKRPILGNRLHEIEQKLDELTLKTEEFNPRYALVLNGEHDDVFSYEPAKSFMDKIHYDHYSYIGYPCGHELTPTMIQDIITYVRSKR
jgi:esterase/lipase